jgi:hypothetical protein
MPAADSSPRSTRSASFKAALQARSSSPTASRAGMPTLGRKASWGVALQARSSAGELNESPFSFRARRASLVRSASLFRTRRKSIVSEEFKRHSQVIAAQLKQRDKDRVFVIDPRKSPLLSIWDGVTTLALLYTALVNAHAPKPTNRKPCSYFPTIPS